MHDKSHVIDWLGDQKSSLAVKVSQSIEAVPLLNRRRKTLQFPVMLQRTRSQLGPGKKEDRING